MKITTKRTKKIAQYGFVTSTVALAATAGNELAVGLVMMLLIVRKFRKFRGLMS